MAKRTFRFGDEIDEAEVVHHRAGDLDDFIDDMESHVTPRAHRGKRSGRQLVDERNETRRLQDLLQDWDDWDENDDLLS